MLTMVSGGLGSPELAKEFPDNRFWSFLGGQFSHVDWSGCSFWDLIMPSFLFMVGVSMVYSYKARRERGGSYRRALTHAMLRSFAFLALGIYLASPFHPLTHFSLNYVLHQIGLASLFAFLLVGRKPVTQTLAALGVLTGYWLAFLLYPAPPAGFDYSTVEVATDFEIFDGYFAHWNKNTNFAAAFDTWFYRSFSFLPRVSRFDDGYHTLNFIPSVATMIFGILAGQYLGGADPPEQKRNRLVLWGLLLVAGGILAGYTLCPIVKRIWTPSWTIFSGGWALLLLALFYHVVDVKQRRRWAFPFIVVGINSLFIYGLSMTSTYWVLKVWRLTLGEEPFSSGYGPIWSSLCVTSSLWLVAAVLYRLKIFIHI